VDQFVKPVGREWDDANFDRYFNNRVKNKPLKSRASVELCEQRFLRYAMQLAAADVKHVPAQALDPREKADESSQSPLYVFDECSHGKSYIMCLGTAAYPTGVDKSRWAMKSQRSDDLIQLRPGLRGRHKFSGARNPELAGRTFEWHVVVDTSSTVPGGFIFQVYEFKSGMLGLRVHTPTYRADNPHGAWRAMYATEAPDSKLSSGLDLCGFHEPQLLTMLKVCSENDISPAAFRVREIRYKALSELGERQAQGSQAIPCCPFCLLGLG
jgi:hypothetical protein